jgi:hypothetical protein
VEQFIGALNDDFGTFGYTRDNLDPAFGCETGLHGLLAVAAWNYQKNKGLLMLVSDYGTGWEGEHVPPDAQGDFTVRCLPGFHLSVNGVTFYPDKPDERQA